jgi:hypothetical protein
MTNMERLHLGDRPDDEPDGNELSQQKREAYVRLSAVWQDALGAGIEPDVLAHVALFSAIGDLVATYGEEAVADFAERLSDRIAAGEFSIPSSVH